MKRTKDSIAKELILIMCHYAASEDWDADRLIDTLEYIGISNSIMEEFFDEKKWKIE